MGWHQSANKMQQGFTMIELLVVMGFISIMTSLAVVNLIRPQQSASVSGSVDVLVADLRGQQLKAMAGDSISSASAQPHGVLIEPDGYTLFKGPVYSAGDTDNFRIDTEGVALSSSLAGSQIVFQQASGEPVSFSEGSNTISASTPAGEPTTITINRYGVITVN